MLFLLFQLGKDRYALEASQVVEVLPLVGLKEIPLSPRGVAGIFNYRGTPVPVLDLSELMLDRPAQGRLSTRLLVVRYAGKDGEKHLLGLVAERATETLHRDPRDFLTSGITNDEAAYLGPVFDDGRGFIQWIEVDKLLPSTVRDLLFQATVKTTSNAQRY